MRERELKPARRRTSPRKARSLPMRERELKLLRTACSPRWAKSLPMRERELKLTIFVRIVVPRSRSPCGSVN